MKRVLLLVAGCTVMQLAAVVPGSATAATIKENAAHTVIQISAISDNARKMIAEPKLDEQGHRVGLTFHFLGPVTAIGRCQLRPESTTSVECPLGARSVEVKLGRFDDTFRAPTLGIPLTIDGGRGNDYLVGGDASDKLSGNSGDDRLVGGGAGDRIAGGPGADVITGAFFTTYYDPVDGVRDHIACGSGSPDRATVEVLIDRWSDCENITSQPFDP